MFTEMSRMIFMGYLQMRPEKMNDDAMDKMEPYDYRGFVTFEMPYLSGYLSERYNYTHDQMQKRADERVERYITDITKSTIVGYSSVNVISNMIRKVNTKCDYVLMPVWVLNCRYKDKDFHFMMNGQTGKIVADRPISGAKTVVWRYCYICCSAYCCYDGRLDICTEKI